MKLNPEQLAALNAMKNLVEVGIINLKDVRSEINGLLRAGLDGRPIDWQADKSEAMASFTSAFKNIVAAYTCFGAYEGGAMPDFGFVNTDLCKRPAATAKDIPTMLAEAAAPSPMRLEAQLLQYAKDEGVAGALRKAEEWRDILEDVAETGDASEQSAAMFLLRQIRTAIIQLVAMQTGGNA